MTPVAISAIAMSFRTVEEGATSKLNSVRSTAYETMKSMHAITVAAFMIAGVIQYGKDLVGIVRASARAIRVGWRFLILHQRRKPSRGGAQWRRPRPASVFRERDVAPDVTTP